MRLLILGGSGMLGHQLWRGLHSQHDTWVTLRRPVADFAVHNLFDEAKAIQFDDITDDTALEGALDQAKPEVVINCVGLIKQRDEASDEALTLRSRGAGHDRRGGVEAREVLVEVHAARHLGKHRERVSDQHTFTKH